MISPHYAKIMHDSRQVATCRRKTRTTTLEAASCSSSTPQLNRSIAFSMSSLANPRLLPLSALAAEQSRPGPHEWRNLGCSLPMTTEASHHNGTFQARDTDELRDTLFRTLRDLRSTRITVHQANAVTTAGTKTLFGRPKRFAS